MDGPLDNNKKMSSLGNVLQFAKKKKNSRNAERTNLL